MALVTVLSADSAVDRAARAAMGEEAAVARAGSWERLTTLVRERPSTGVVVDSALLEGLPGLPGTEAALVDLATRFPSLWVVLVARREMDPMTLFRLGRRGLRGLVLTRLDDIFDGTQDGVRRAMRTGTEALVARAFSPYLPGREARAVRLALRGVQLGWATEDLAVRVGLTRPHLSVCLRQAGLPSAGQLLIWAKLMHAGRWLTDPGRSGESVSRQLDYSNGAAFRRLLRNYLGLTPTELRERDGLAAVLDAFADTCGLHEHTRLTAA